MESTPAQGFLEGEPSLPTTPDKSRHGTRNRNAGSHFWRVSNPKDDFHQTLEVHLPQIAAGDSRDDIQRHLATIITAPLA